MEFEWRRGVSKENKYDGFAGAVVPHRYRIEDIVFHELIVQDYGEDRNSFEVSFLMDFFRRSKSDSYH